MRHTVYLFDGFQLDVTRRKLISSGGLVQPLNSRAMEALLLLVANAGELIEKRRLMQTVWPDAVVEDNNLNQSILAIRKALGEAAGSNRYVMTVPGRGYRFVCPVRELVQESPADAPLPQVAPRRPSSALHWGLIGAMCAAAIAVVALVAPRFTRDTATPIPAGTDGSVTSDPARSSIVLRLRTPAHLATDSVESGPAAALARCLAAHPEMTLQIRVRLVTGQGAPLWTGEFTAGAQDLIPVPMDDLAPLHGCRDLVAPSRNERCSVASR